MDMLFSAPDFTRSTATRRPLATAIGTGIFLAFALPLSASASDETALQALIAATGGDASPLVTERGWGSGQPCTSGWVGILCDSNNKVTELKLANISLTGELPPDIEELTELTILDLSNTGITGNIPDGIGNLTKLKTLLLTQNALKGAVPVGMKDLTELTTLDLSYNMLTSSNDTETDAFLSGLDADWTATQTVAPTGLEITGTTIDTISLKWTPIAYTGNGGKYEIIVSPDADLSVADDKLYESDDKTSDSITIAGLSPSTEYFLAIRTRTDNIPGTNGRQLVSDFSASVSDFTLLDTDRDGTADAEDSDADNDGISNTVETLTKDSDGDGILDYLEPNNVDTDGDGDPNYLDPDDDGDGNPTQNELGSNPAYPADSDNDGIRDYLDPDSNNAAGTKDGSGDSDNDGQSDKTECPNVAQCADTDGDGLPNYMDANDDNDIRSSADEGATLDSDSDGVIDALEPNRADTDGDGINNHEDPDDDGDGRPTRDELGASPLEPRDKDGDNIPDYLDADSDNKADTDDKSGDSDGDGISDHRECPAAPSCPDVDGNGVPSYMDANEKTDVAALQNAVLGDSEERSSGGGGSLALSLLGAIGGLAAGLRRRRMLRR
jgi:hypothetical protein